ncbi:hypothetical protein [Lysobacter terrae]
MAPFDATSLVVGITGHRNLHPSSLPALRERLRAFFVELGERYPHLPIVLLSSLAEGSDQLAAQVALDLGLGVIAPLPLPVSLYREDFDNPGSLVVFEQQLQRVEVLQLPLRHGVGIEEASQRGAARDRQYAQAGIFVSSHCQILLALWDGVESDRLGGTSQVVRFHLTGELPGTVERRRDTTLALLGLDEETLVYHLPAARAVAPETRMGPGRWLTAEDGVVAHERMPGIFDLMFRRQEQFNDDCGKYAADIEAASGDADMAAAMSACPIYRQFVSADWLARTYQRRVNQVLRIVYLLAAAMGFAFFLYTHITAHYLVINLFLLFFLSGMAVVLVSRRHEWQRKYLDYRALAEGLRVQSYWRRAGITDLQSPAFAHDNFMHKQDVELGWIRNVMRSASVEGLLAAHDADEAAVDAVIGEWIGANEGGGQLQYFCTAAARRRRLHRRAEVAGLACLWVGVGISAILAIFSRRFDLPLQHILVSTMGILSVAAAVHEAYAYKKADKELIKQYHYMQRIFGAARRRLNGCNSLREKQHLLRTLGEAALAEHAEWTLMHRERPLEHSRL